MNLTEELAQGILELAQSLGYVIDNDNRICLPNDQTSCQSVEEWMISVLGAAQYCEQNPSNPDLNSSINNIDKNRLQRVAFLQSTYDSCWAAVGIILESYYTGQQYGNEENWFNAKRLSSYAANPEPDSAQRVRLGIFEKLYSEYLYDIGSRSETLFDATGISDGSVPNDGLRFRPYSVEQGSPSRVYFNYSIPIFNNIPLIYPIIKECRQSYDPRDIIVSPNPAHEVPTASVQLRNPQNNQFISYYQPVEVAVPSSFHYLPDEFRYAWFVKTLGMFEQYFAPNSLTLNDVHHLLMKGPFITCVYWGMLNVRSHAERMNIMNQATAAEKCVRHFIIVYGLERINNVWHVQYLNTLRAVGDQNAEVEYGSMTIDEFLDMFVFLTDKKGAPNKIYTVRWRE